MFIAMNRFRVAKGSEAAFEHVWLSRDTFSRRCRALSSFTFSRVPKLRPTPSMLLTRCGKTVLCLKPGPSRRRFGRRTGGQGVFGSSAV
jgi:hypothetical protein